MTIEAKAKAYDEAVKKAKEIKSKILSSHLSTESCKAISKYIDEIIPELKDSEDERIRKVIYKLMLGMREEIFTSQDEIVTKEKVLAYLEKQKENPKSTDSIPADCVLDAKCEDRWHKVGDSLPNNPREVLCKDEAGNYFIGRYYVGEGWEISNYDDEDKPHHLNPPVSKWIDFPSEKHKGPLPIPDKFSGLKSLMLQYLQSAANRKDDVEIESDTDLWGRKILDYVWKYSDEQKEQKEIPLMNGDADLYFDDWFQHNDTTKRGCFEEGIRYAQRLQKEQKPAEWSDGDEKMLNELITIMDGGIVTSGTYLSEYAAWLKSLPERFVLEPKNEWSEEDERMRNQLIYDVEYHKKEGLISAKQNKATKALYNGIEECYDEKIAWLKSLPERFNLQPKQEWSEQEQPDFPTTDEQMKEFLATHPKIKVPEKYKNPDWLFKKQEQPKVDLEKALNELDNAYFDLDGIAVQGATHYLTVNDLKDIARDFYERGLRRAAEMYDEIEYNRQRAEEESK